MKKSHIMHHANPNNGGWEYYDFCIIDLDNQTCSAHIHNISSAFEWYTKKVLSWGGRDSLQKVVPIDVADDWIYCGVCRKGMFK